MVQRSKVCRQQVQVYIETNKEQVKEVVSVEVFSSVFFFPYRYSLRISLQNVFGHSEKQLVEICIMICAPFYLN